LLLNSINTNVVYNFKRPVILKNLLIITLLFSLHSYGQKSKNPVVVNKYKLLGQFRKTTNMEMWERNVQYLGHFKDTIFIQKISDLRSPIGDNKILIEDSLSKNYSFYGNGKLTVVVDTTQIVTLEEYEWWTKERKYKYYKSHPIFISNLSDTTTNVGYGYNIPIILEALDSGKIWKPIEVRYIYDCGVGLEYVLLKPGNILCVLAPIYTGNYKTKLRYKLGSCYSTEFLGTINRKQFKSNKKTFRW
jgi:hypothetical protein